MQHLLTGVFFNCFLSNPHHTSIFLNFFQITQNSICPHLTAIAMAKIKPVIFLIILSEAPRPHCHLVVASSSQEIWPPARCPLDEALSLNEDDENLLPNQMSHDCLTELNLNQHSQPEELMSGHAQSVSPLIPFLETLHNSHNLNIKY